MNSDVKSAMDNEMIKQISICCDLIIKNTENMDKMTVRKWQQVLNHQIDSFCLDGTSVVMTKIGKWR